MEQLFQLYEAIEISYSRARQADETHSNLGNGKISFPHKRIA